jgi:hypothetical protein
MRHKRRSSPSKRIRSRKSRKRSFRGARRLAYVAPGDGNCLFHCLSRISGIASHREARRKVVEEINKNWDSDVYHFVCGDKREYLDFIGKEGSWGGEIEIYAFVKSLEREGQKVKIGVKNVSRGGLKTSYGEGEETACLEYNGVHYNVLKEG